MSAFLNNLAVVAVVAAVLLSGVGLAVGALLAFFDFFIDGEDVSRLVACAVCTVLLLIEIAVVATLAQGRADHRPICGYDHRSKGPDAAVRCDVPVGAR